MYEVTQVSNSHDKKSQDAENDYTIAQPSFNENMMNRTYTKDVTEESIKHQIEAARLKAEIEILELETKLALSKYLKTSTPVAARTGVPVPDTQRRPSWQETPILHEPRDDAATTTTAPPSQADQADQAGPQQYDLPMQMQSHERQYEMLRPRQYEPMHDQPQEPFSTLNPTAPSFKPETHASLLPQQQQLASQHEAYSSMASAVRESISVPKPEIISFSGDPKDYHRFMRCFEANIDKRVEDSGLKLNYLIQFCNGEAKEAIQDSVILNPEEGYERAKNILKTRYGRPHTIVRALVQELTSGPTIRSNDGEALSKMAARMRRCEMTLQQMNFTADLNNFETILKIARRLPQSLRAKWVERADQIIEQGSEPTFHDLSDFVEKRARVATTLYGQNLLETPKDPRSQNLSVKSPVKKPATTLITKADNTPKKPPSANEKKVCWLCKRDHNLTDCQQFREISYDERWKVTRDNGLCDNCLRRGHRSRQCGIKSRCTVEGCTWKHNVLLHPPTAPVQSASASMPDKSEHDPPEESGKSFMTGGTPDKIFFRVVPVQVHGRNKIIQTYALLDNCSDITLCENELINKLGIESHEKSFNITTLSDTKCLKKGKEVRFSVSSVDGTEHINLDQVWSVDKIPVDTRCIPTPDELKKWPHLRDLTLPAIEEAEVTILIGSDVPEVFWQLEERRGKRKEPYAAKSLLGWTVIGPSGNKKGNAGNVNFVKYEDEVLQKQVENFWKSDFSEKFQGKSMSVEDKRALKIYEETAVKIDGHLQVGLPWRRNPPDLVNNRTMAEARTRHLKRKLKADPELHTSYKEVMEGYISKGHAQKASPCSPDDVAWYLPHHPVIHPKKRKLRIVFDCAARFGGKSLNDELMQGPDLMNSLVGVLHRFRQKSIAISGDVEAMFHQVKVTPSDCNALRFLWWSDDIDEKPEDYQMLVHLFGATSSPSVCCWALRQTAIQYGETYDAKVLATVDCNFYVDDCLVSVDTNEEAKKLVKDLTSLLQEGGFRLTKWVSNSREVMSAIPEAERAKSVVNLDPDELPIERALGISWNVENDCFQFNSALRKKPATKRGLLSVISSLYDPLGFVAPVTLTAKKLLQELCRQQVGWDEPIDEEINAEWNEWLRDLDIISKISIKRCFIPVEFGKVTTIELHIFADASETGYGSVAYLRLVNSVRQVHCSFVMGKSRLAPLKPMTIPLLELSAAVVATRLKTLLEQELEMEIDRTTLWTDSTSVLQYIRNERRRFKTFIANRLSEIQDNSQSAQWRYVDTARNPADIASRGLKPSNSDALQVWLNGPEFLREDKANWPQNPEMLPELDASEVKQTIYFTVGEPAVVDELIERYSSWHKLQRAMAWILRFKQYCVKKWLQQDKENCSKGYLTVEELRDAEEVLLRHTQQSTLRKSDLKKLNPMMKDGLMRVGGRLQHAPVNYEAKHPIILPNKHHITSLIIRHHHESVGHSGCDFVLSSVRQRFWIVKGRATVKREIGQCMVCKKRSAPRGEQFMAPLPTPRLTPDKAPFTFTGVDYFGPLYVKQGRSTAKRYGCLFTCMTTRAVHIEIAYSLDTDSFLGALQRFVSKRGKPEKILSDNGTNFRGGEKELRQEIEKWNKTKINNVLLQQEIQWSFNPPGASHMGGIWERMIRTTRKILKILTNEQLVNDETLLTLMAEAEKIINDRPLTPPSSDPMDLEPLTPSKLLLLKPNLCLPPGVFDKRDQYVRRWYKQAQYLADIFWNRWLREYLPTLQARQKWTTHKRNLKAGDLVLIVDERVPRGMWPLGQVIKTIADKDGDVRSAEVKTAEGYKYRPVTKLCFLEADDSFDTSKELQSNLQIESDDEDIEDIPDKDIEDIPATSSSVSVRPKRPIKKPERYKDYV